MSQEIEINTTENGTCPRGYTAPETHHVGHIPAQNAMRETDHDQTPDKPKSRDILYN